MQQGWDLKLNRAFAAHFHKIPWNVSSQYFDLTTPIPRALGSVTGIPKKENMANYVYKVLKVHLFKYETFAIYIIKGKAM
jgi:hypothetical protein